MGRYIQDINYLFEWIIDLGYNKRKQNEWDTKDWVHYQTMFYTIVMDSCSYLQEYERQFVTNSDPNFQPRVKEVELIAKPALDKINEWEDLHNFRNEIIAHNLRVRSQNYKFSFHKLGQYDAPRTYLDIVLLRKYLVMIQSVIEAEFHDEIPNIKPFIDAFTVQKVTTDYSTVEQDITTLVEEINQRCFDQAKNYALKLDVFMNL